MTPPLILLTLWLLAAALGLSGAATSSTPYSNGLMVAGATMLAVAALGSIVYMAAVRLRAVPRSPARHRSGA